MKYLVIGGAGYIGSHFVKAALADGHDVTVFDDLSRGLRAAVDERATLVQGDLLDRPRLESLVAQLMPDAIFHFAALALVGESVKEPALYYRNNVQGVINLLDSMVAVDCRAALVFSSTCAVFGEPAKLPIAEDDRKAPISPYGRSKLMAEFAIEDYARAYGFKAMALRYFNACGADASGTIGEAHDPETHLIPNVIKAVLQGETLTIFGDDFATADGTCERDYVHVSDLVAAHLAAARHLARPEAAPFTAVHLGTGRPFSNLSIVKAVERVTGRAVRYQFGPRRPGDPQALYTDNRKATELLGFAPKFSDLDTIVATAWRWHESHPRGYLD